MLRRRAWVDRQHQILAGGHVLGGIVIVGARNQAWSSLKWSRSRRLGGESPQNELQEVKKGLHITLIFLEGNLVACMGLGEFAPWALEVRRVGIPRGEALVREGRSLTRNARSGQESSFPGFPPMVLGPGDNLADKAR